MIQKFRNKGVVPNGGFVRYQDPNDGWTFAHPYYKRVVLMAHEHRVANNLSIPHDWETWVEQRICEATPGACVELDNAPISAHPSKMEMATHFAGAMFRWLKSGFKITSWETFDARMTQCRGDAAAGIPRCPYFHTSSGGWNFVHCEKCGCSKLKLFVSSERCPIGKW